MKIGIDVRLWNETGVGRYIRNLVSELQEIDQTNEYVLFAQTKDIASLNAQIGKLKIKKNWQVVPADIRWHSLQEQSAFPKILYSQNLDLMHFPYFSLPISYNRPFVVTIHDLIINHFPTGRASTLPLPFYYAKRFAYDVIVRHSVKNAKKIIVPLHAVKDDVMQTLGVREEEIAVTYEGVDLLSSLRSGLAGANPLHEIATSPIRLSRTDPRNDVPYFLYVGNAYPHKNLERLLEAFKLFKDENKSNVQLLLVGKDDYFYKRLKQKVKKENHTDVVFRHNVDDKTLFSLYSEAISFVSPSLMEGFGLPTLEAMSASCPVLVSDIPAFREVCKNVAFYFDPKDILGIKNKLVFMYNLDQSERQKHIAAGLSRIHDFSWKRMAEQTKRVYESSIGI